MPRIESYTSAKIDTLFEQNKSDSNLALDSAIELEVSRADNTYRVSDFVVVRKTGTNADIQPVFNLAETTGGGSVTIPRGVWLINVALLIPSNVTLNCSPGAIFKRNKATVTNLIRNKSSGSVGGYTANQDIRIIGGEWDGNKAAFPGVTCTAIAFGHCTNVSVEEAEFYGIDKGNQVKLAAVYGGAVSNCTFRDYPSGQEMLQIEGMYAASGSNEPFEWFGPYDNYPCSDILVEGNTFLTGNYGVGSRTSVIGHRHRNVRIIGNHITGMSTYGIRLQDYENCIVDGNTISNCGIGIYGSSVANQVCSGYTISNNIITGCTTIGSKLDGSTDNERWIRRVSYTGNIIRSCGMYGLHDPFTYYSTYVGNTVTECGIIGMRNYNQREVTITGNTVVGNNTTNYTGGADMKIGDYAADETNDTQNVIVGSNIIGTLFIRTGNNILIVSNFIMYGYTLSIAAPPPVDVHRSANFIQGTYYAT